MDLAPSHPSHPIVDRSRLSVVVTIVEGGPALDRCLQMLLAQEETSALEILVPYDESVAGIAGLIARYPTVRFLPVAAAPVDQVRTPREQHELFDRRRSAGLAAASGEVVAILEDRGVPLADWASVIMRLHAELPHAVIGGAVENGVDRLVNWAVYFCDFSRYQRPFAAGPVQWVTDVNVSYKRRALLPTEPLWRDRYHEPVVHAALLAAGETLYLTPEFAVVQERRLTALGLILRERLHWGRLFAYTRIRSEGLAKRIVYVLLSPLIPLVVFGRQARLQRQKGHLRVWLRAAPLVALLVAVWGVGELLGYLTGRP